MTNEMNTTDKNPIVWVLMQNVAILGAYSRPEWAAYAVSEKLLAQEYLVPHDRHHEFAPYILSDGYTGECDLEFTYNPTVEQIEALILERTDVMGVTICGIDRTAYALNIVPVVMDA
jgi:hypothetical protein